MCFLFSLFVLSRVVNHSISMSQCARGGQSTRTPLLHSTISNYSPLTSCKCKSSQAHDDDVDDDDDDDDVDVMDGCCYLA